MVNRHDETEWMNFLSRSTSNKGGRKFGFELKKFNLNSPMDFLNDFESTSINFGLINGINFSEKKLKSNETNGYLFWKSKKLDIENTFTDLFDIELRSFGIILNALNSNVACLFSKYDDGMLEVQFNKELINSMGIYLDNFKKIFSLYFEIIQLRDSNKLKGNSKRILKFHDLYLNFCENDRQTLIELRNVFKQRINLVKKSKFLKNQRN